MTYTTNKKQYAIGQLSNLTGYKRRTIHYYSKQGVIPPPEGVGLGAHYTDEHLLRLLLIRYFKKSHLKLPGIREAFDAMNIHEMRKLVDKAQIENPEWNFPSLKNWIVDSTKPPEDSPLFQMRGRIGESEETATYQTNYMETVKRKAPESTRWEKFILEDGIEVHIRSDKIHRNKKILDSMKKSLEEHHV